MAEEQNGQERTEEPTKKRLDDARKKGQVPRSRELTMMAVTLSGAAALLMFSRYMGDYLVEIMQRGLAFDSSLIRNGIDAPGTTSDARLLGEFGVSVGDSLILLAPLFGVVMAAALLAPMALGGWTFSVQALAPKLDKLNPIKGLARVFGPKGLMELAKAMAKFGLVAVAAVIFLNHYAEEFLNLSRLPLMPAINSAAWLCGLCLLLLSSVLIIVAAVDVPFQMWEYRRKMRMTKRELKDENKETEGSPELKGRVRSMQQELANRRMIEAVPAADVVVTNPTHYAVALRYDAEKMGAPRVVAKGADLIAARIRDVASKHGVPLIEAPPLARALYKTTKLGREIPAGLYLAVAQILTYVYQLKYIREAGGAPGAPPNPDIDEEYFE